MRFCFGAHLVRDRGKFFNDPLVLTRVALIFYLRLLFLGAALVVLPIDSYGEEVGSTDPVTGCDVVLECSDIINEHFVHKRYEEAVAILSDALRGVRTEKHCIGLLLPFYDKLPTQTSEDSILASKAYRVLGYTTRTFLNDLPAALDFYHRAKALQGDTCCSAKYWSVNYPVGSLYARLGDNEKAAVQYSEILDKLQLQGRDIDRQVLLLKELANLDLWRGYRDAALDKINEGLTLAETDTLTSASASRRVVDARVALLLAKVEWFLASDDGSSASDTWKVVYDVIQADSTKVKTRRWSKLHELRSKLFLQEQDTIQAIMAQRRSLAATVTDLRNGGVRAVAKSRLLLLQTLIQADHVTEAHAEIDAIKAIYLSVPKNARTLDNTWVQLLALELQLSVQDPLSTCDTDQLSSWQKQVEYLYFLLRQMEDDVVTLVDKLNVRRLRKMLDSHYLLVLHELYVRGSVDWSTVRMLVAGIKDDPIGRSAASRQEVGDDVTDNELKDIDTRLRELVFASHVDSVNLRIQLLDQQQALLGETSSRVSLYEGPFIEYFVVEGYIYYFGLTDHHFFVKRRINKNLRDHIEFVREATTEQADLANVGSVDVLRKALFPFDIRLPSEFAIVVDDAMQSVPFDLVYSINTSNPNAELPLYHLRRSQYCFGQQGPARDEVLVVQPDYKTVDYQQYSLGELEFAAEEVDTLAKLAHVDVLRSASMEEVVESASSKRILHYTGHAVGGLRPQLLLTHEGQVEPVMLDQLINWTTYLDLMVLSTCESGLGAGPYGEIVPSLSSSLLATGVPMVLMSQWAVNEETTAALLESFYYYLLTANYSPVEALQKAKKHYRSTQPPDRQHPYYWAGLQIVSQAPYTHVSTAPAGVIYCLLLLIIIIVLCVFLFFRFVS